MPAVEFDPDTILFHADGLLAVDKPSGLPLWSDPDANRGGVPGPGLIELLGQWVSLHPRVLDTAPNKPFHPIHLLDKESSGVVLIALSPKVARRLQARVGDIERRYIAVVAGPLPPRGTLEGRVRSKTASGSRWLGATLEWVRLAGDERTSVVEVVPKSHRSHQIRALFSQANRPIVGDERYGKPAPVRKFREIYGIDRLMLHLRSTTIPAEVLGPQIRIEAPLPAEMAKFLESKGWILP
jgi:23S rRNA-/tRNA-specific pseudouridylate synthase